MSPAESGKKGKGRRFSVPVPALLFYHRVFFNRTHPLQVSRSWDRHASPSYPGPGRPFLEQLVHNVNSHPVSRLFATSGSIRQSGRGKEEEEKDANRVTGDRSPISTVSIAISKVRQLCLAHFNCRSSPTAVWKACSATFS